MGPRLFDLAACAIGSTFLPRDRGVPTKNVVGSAGEQAGGSSGDVLDLDRLGALLAGYCTEVSPPLSESETSLFVPMMRAVSGNLTYASVLHFSTHLESFLRNAWLQALLCNCAWRFANFNIDHREIEGCQNGAIFY